MDCPNREKIVLFVRDNHHQLTEKEKKSIENHLRNCDDCNRLFKKIFDSTYQMDLFFSEKKTADNPIANTKAGLNPLLFYFFHS